MAHERKNDAIFIFVSWLISLTIMTHPFSYTYHHFILHYDWVKMNYELCMENSLLLLCKYQSQHTIMIYCIPMFICPFNPGTLWNQPSYSATHQWMNGRRDSGIYVYIWYIWYIYIYTNFSNQPQISKNH